LQRAQSKFEHLAQASRKDIASVIARELQLRSSDASQNEPEAEKLLSSARLKAEKLIVDDEACDLMGILERYCDVLLEGQLTERYVHASMLSSKECDDFESAAQLDPDCLEAVSGILATSSRVDSPGNAMPPAGMSIKLTVLRIAYTQPVVGTTLSWFNIRI